MIRILRIGKGWQVWQHGVRKSRHKSEASAQEAARYLAEAREIEEAERGERSWIRRSGF